ncbi:MAG: imidazole glycerol phosphate synthase subunit HisH [Aquificaceae bacterium]|nr:imidazole glycerol phosphate synthase subunit HisH [Aquificaceae bacterium]MDW8237214.1 imidazole glycerol phosphate synthase subunit HisH [Aquificaceae bacterium]
MRVGVLNYGAGNVGSILNSLSAIGVDASIILEPRELSKVRALIVPGVGAFSKAMQNLRIRSLDRAILEFIKEGGYYLGICLGLQILFQESLEFGQTEGLKVLEGKVIKLPDSQKLPHIGWNSVKIVKKSMLFEGIEDLSYFYFVHSYRVETLPEFVIGSSFYGEEFPSAIEKDNVFAVQFHPEKSDIVGLKLLKNFAEIALAKALHST